MKKDEKREKRGGIRATKSKIITLVIIAGCSFGMLFIGAYAGLAQHAEAVFAPGTVAGDIDLGGMTYEDGRELLLEQEDALLGSIHIPVEYNGAEHIFSAKELGLTSNAVDILQEAYGRDKTGSEFLDFDAEKQAQAYDLEPVVDEEALEKCVGSFLQRNDTPAKDAQAEFNPNARKFSYVAEENGRVADLEKVCAQVSEQILSGSNDTIYVKGETTLPQVTEQDLRNNTVPIGRYSTKSASNDNRDVNISLIAGAVNGFVLAPGETLSINDLVGERTAEKGYLPAPAITDGTNLTDELGGGICQLAGTLYNAALLADMEIVERVHHSWPSDYLPVGRDATLNWDNKDLKLKNNTEWPMYFSARYEDHIVDVAIYGHPSEYEISIESKILEEYPKPEPEVIYTDELAVGEERTKVTGREGYVAETTRNYLKDGVVVRSELVSKDTFHEIQGVVLRGSDVQNK